MTQHTCTTLGLFSNYERASQTITDLTAAGFPGSEISVILQDADRAKEIAQNTGTDVAQGAALGAGRGAVLGGLAGLVIGVSAIAVPGIGPLLIGGPLAAALTASGAGALTGALAGGFVGALTAFGLSAEEAQHYADAIKRGDILVAVATDKYTEQQVEIALTAHGATDVRTVHNKDAVSETGEAASV
jgi:hypothetical protein